MERIHVMALSPTPQRTISTARLESVRQILASFSNLRHRLRRPQHGPKPCSGLSVEAAMVAIRPQA